MRITVLSLLGVLGGGCAARPVTADEPDAIDLLDRVQPVAAYNPRVEPQVRCIRSHDEATLFCSAAWDEENDALHVDFEHEQIVAVAWGVLRWAAGSAGSGIGIHLEQATLHGGTLRIRVRTVIPPGPGIDVGADQPGQNWYPSLFVRTPRTDRVEVDLFGARRHEPAADFRPVATKDLEVRIAPDESPSRTLVSFVGQRDTAAAKMPTIGLFRRDGHEVLEVAWGELGPGSYRLELVGVSIDKGVAHLTLRADNRRIFLYSGPGVHTPGLAVALPPVEKVLLRIERKGVPLAPGEPDFEDQTSGRLVVTVDRSAMRGKQ